MSAPNSSTIKRKLLPLLVGIQLVASSFESTLPVTFIAGHPPIARQLVPSVRCTFGRHDWPIPNSPKITSQFVLVDYYDTRNFVYLISKPLCFTLPLNKGLSSSNHLLWVNSSERHLDRPRPRHPSCGIHIVEILAHLSGCLRQSCPALLR